MAIYLNEEKQPRFNQLIALFTTGDISDEQEAELIALRKELKQNKTERSDKLSAIKNQIAELGVAIAELYSTDEIAIAAQGSIVNVNIPVKIRGAENKKEYQKARASDSNEILLILRNEPGVKGPSEWSYRQGRIYERASGTTSQPWAMRPKQYPTKLLKIGYSADLLRPFFTPAGIAYFSTEQGQAELAKLVEVTLHARHLLQVV